MEDIFNQKVIMVMGITDIDDKIIKAASSKGGVDSVRDVARRYEKEFIADLSKLSIRMPTITARVTDYIPEIISFIDGIIKKGFAYSTDDGK